MRNFANFQEENIAYWSRRAPGYSVVNQEELTGGQRRVWSSVICEQIQNHYGNRPPEEISILDVGTGPGFFAIIMARRGYRVTAVDYTLAMLEHARENAGAMADRITFLQMNAEELAFSDKSFDVVISRNLTWNLKNPEKAYGHWARVLKKGGLLLNFDASWYGYLYDDRAREKHLKDRDNVARSDVRDENAGTDVAAMEAIARQTPLAALCRPEWDIDVLNCLGMQAVADQNIWERVWTHEERINNTSTPMFLIRAVKNLGETTSDKRNK